MPHFYALNLCNKRYFKNCAFARFSSIFTQVIYIISAYFEAITYTKTLVLPLSSILYNILPVFAIGFRIDIKIPFCILYKMNIYIHIREFLFFVFFTILSFCKYILYRKNPKIR